MNEYQQSLVTTLQEINFHLKKIWDELKERNRIERIRLNLYDDDTPLMIVPPESSPFIPDLSSPDEFINNNTILGSISKNEIDGLSAVEFCPFGPLLNKNQENE
jgi:hypothetical protein